VALNYDGVLGWIAAKQKGAVQTAPLSTSSSSGERHASRLGDPA